MYRFSRAIYRELEHEVEGDLCIDEACAREQFLRACERAIERLAADPRYFGEPARSLFDDVRMYFPVSRQLRVYRVIERYMALAAAFVEVNGPSRVAPNGNPMYCSALTRKGEFCQRGPLPGSRYCPSHRHLESEARDACAEVS